MSQTTLYQSGIIKQTAEKKKTAKYIKPLWTGGQIVITEELKKEEIQ